MNSVDFDFLLGATPRDPALKDAQRAEVGADAELRLARALAFERRLEQAFTIAEPAEMRSRILAAHRQLEASPSRRALLRAAAAIGAVALTGALGWKMGRPSAEAKLAAECVEHLSHEPFALTRSEVIAESLVREMFASHGVELKQSPGALAYLNPCGLHGQKAIHALAQEPAGPVTVMYLPQSRGMVESELRQGAALVRITPYAHGALVLIAESNRDFNHVEQRFRRALA